MLDAAGNWPSPSASPGSPSPDWHKEPVAQCASCFLSRHQPLTDSHSQGFGGMARQTSQRVSCVSAPSLPGFWETLPHRLFCLVLLLTPPAPTDADVPSVAAAAFHTRAGRLTLGLVRCCSLLSSRSLCSRSNSSLISAGVLLLSTT